MRAIAFVLLALAFASALVACPEPPKPPTPLPPNAIDSGDFPGPDGIVEVFPEDSGAAQNSPCGKACANLANIPCREGYANDSGVTCYRACVAMAEHQRVPTLCWSTARSQSEVRACGGLRCLTP